MAYKLGQLKLYPNDTGNPTRAQIHQLILSQIPGYIQEYKRAVGVTLTPAEVIVEMAGHWIIDKYRQAESEAKEQIAQSQGDNNEPIVEAPQTDAESAVQDSGSSQVSSAESQE